MNKQTFLSCALGAYGAFFSAHYLYAPWRKTSATTDGGSPTLSRSLSCDSLKIEDSVWNNFEKKRGPFNIPNNAKTCAKKILSTLHTQGETNSQEVTQETLTSEFGSAIQRMSRQLEEKMSPATRSMYENIPSTFKECSSNAPIPIQPVEEVVAAILKNPENILHKNLAFIDGNRRVEGILEALNRGARRAGVAAAELEQEDIQTAHLLLQLLSDIFEEPKKAPRRTQNIQLLRGINEDLHELMAIMAQHATHKTTNRFK